MLGQRSVGFSRGGTSIEKLLIRGTHYNAALQQSWNIDGPGWVKLVPLEVLTADTQMALYEQAWIDRLTLQGRGCYNLMPARENPPYVRKPPVPLPNEFVLKLSDVAAHLMVNVMTVGNLVRSGKLKAFRVGRHWRVKREALQAFIHRPASPKRPPSITEVNG